MRIARKLTLALVLAVSSVLAIHGFLAARRELAFFEAESRRESRAMGRALTAVVSEVWRTQGEARARELLAQANEREAAVNFRFVDLASVDPAQAPVVSPARIGELSPTREAIFREDDRTVTYVPLSVDGIRRATIEVSASLAEQQRYVQRSVAAMVITAAVTISVAGALTILLGAFFVGRPLRALMVKARRIGEGDLEGPLTLDQRDELGELANEINAMCVRLGDERSARQRAVDEARHAHRLAVVGRLGAGIAHELGTPLHVVKGWSNMIASREVEGEAALEAARNVSFAAERMAAIIRQLLDFARQRSSEKEPVELVALARRTSELLGPIAQKRKVSFSVDGTEAWVDADPNQLQQAVANLVMNGLDAMPEGGRLEIAIGEVRATPPADIGGDESEWIRVRVRDAGPGIAPEHIDHVFEPFFTTKPVGEGTGLGLSVSYGVIREHGGWISVDSKPGHGACFDVHLPKRGVA